MRFSKWCAILPAILMMFVLPTAGAVAPDVKTISADREYFAIDVGPLVAKFGKSHIVSDPPIIVSSFYQMDSSPRVVVPEGIEAYLLEPENRNDNYSGYRIIGKKPRGRAIDGKLFLLRRHPDQPRESVLVKLDFRVDADSRSNPGPEDFFRAKGRYFQRMWSEEMAGSAMFRHLAMTSLKEAGESARSTGPNWPLNGNTGVDRTIALLSGGRAVSENLQLDKQLPLPDQDSSHWKPLSEVRGITVRAINWDDLLSDQPTELDALAKLVPHDQYAVYLPSFSAFAEIVDRGGEIAKPAVQLFEPQSRKTDALGFYQKQLALPLNAVTRFAGKALIDEVAVTGSDPYFRTGTDVAVLMQSDQPDLLHDSILSQVAAEAAKHPHVKRIEHRVDRHTFIQWSTENRVLSSFVGRARDTVVVSNSLHQMLQILKCSDGRVKNMHGLDEYRFFRQRYPRNTEAESALVVVTDAAIRRWCGPSWRIAASRRTRARATIAEVTMRHADDLVYGTMTGTTQVHSVAGMPNVGSMKVFADGVQSKVYGTLDFQTPIAEMDMKWASTQEINLYNRWRTQYERRWRRTFDPIAMQLSLTDRSIHVDLSVIPLMVQSDYRQYTQLVGNARIKPGAGDPHPEALGEFTIALDTKSSLMQMARMVLANGVAEVDLLAWIDGSATVYFDYDEAWMKRYDTRSPWEMSPEDLIRDVPVGFFIPSKDNFRMAAFMVAVRSALRRFTPNLFQWESVKYQDFEYVVGTILQGNAIGSAEDMPQLFYVTTSEGLTLSANRGVIERAIDRHLVTKQPREEANQIAGKDKSAAPNSESNPQVSLTATGKGVEIMSRTNYRSGLRRMNRIAWSNIPILNYLRGRYPDLDPRGVYQKLFRQTLQEPSGGKYVWDSELGTYVSTLQGYHLEPKAGPSISPVLQPADRIKATVLFKDDGLRATLNVTSEK